MHLNVCNIGCSAPLPGNCYCIFFTFCSTLDYWIWFFKMKKTKLCGWTQMDVRKVKYSKPCAFIHLSCLGFLWSLYNAGLSTSWLFKYCNRTLYSAYRIYFSFSAVSKYHNSTLQSICYIQMHVQNKAARKGNFQTFIMTPESKQQRQGPSKALCFVTHSAISHLYLHWWPNDHCLFLDIFIELWRVVIDIQHSYKHFSQAVFPICVLCFHIEIILGVHFSIQYSPGLGVNYTCWWVD